jgi:hypothetical protein
LIARRTRKRHRSFIQAADAKAVAIRWRKRVRAEKFLSLPGLMGPKLKTELRKFQTFVCSQFVGAFAVIGPVAPVIAICGIPTATARNRPAQGALRRGCDRGGIRMRGAFRPFLISIKEISFASQRADAVCFRR